MRLRPVILCAVGVALGGCGDPKTAPAEEVVSLSYVASASPPRIVLTEATKVNAGSRGKSTKYRFDVRDVESGTQVGVYVFARDELWGPRCLPGEGGRVWCWTTTDPRIETWDISTFKLSEDLESLAAKIPAMGDVVLNRGFQSVPGTGELVVHTGRGEQWIVGADPVRDDGTQDYQKRLRGEFADQPERSFSLNKDTEKGEFLSLAVERTYHLTDFPAAGIKLVQMLSDSSTNDWVYFENEQVVVGEIQREDGSLQLIGMGFDQKTKWTTDLGRGHISQVARLPDAVVLALSTKEAKKLVSVGIADGAVRWSHEL